MRPVRSVAGRPVSLVVLEDCRKEQEERHRRVDHALVRDVDVGQLLVMRPVVTAVAWSVCLSVGQLLVHRLVQSDHRHHVNIRDKPKET